MVCLVYDQSQNPGDAAPEGRCADPFFRGALADPSAFGADSAGALRRRGFNAVAFDLSMCDSLRLKRTITAALQSRLKVYGWVQVGRDEAAAREHPAGMHTPQHDEWLEGPGPKGAVVWPGVCVNNRAVSDSELMRVERMRPHQ